MNRPPLFFVIVVAIIVVAAGFRFVQQRRERIENEAAPLVEKRVTVAGKREQPVTDRRTRQRQVTPVEDIMHYEADFRAVDGPWRATFRLKASQYHALTVGLRGTLRYQGTRFISFEPAGSTP